MQIYPSKKNMFCRPHAAQGVKGVMQQYGLY